MMKMLAPATLIWQLSDVLLISGIKKCLVAGKLGTLFAIWECTPNWR